MSSVPPIHLCVVQPVNYVHWMALLDPVRYYRWQFRRLGAEVTVAKNRLRHDAINFVFGAHLGFDPALRERYACIFVNLEQLGDGGTEVAPAYQQLLASSGVVDYDARNVGAYAADPLDVPIAPVLYAPYLATVDPVPLEERPIDLLFFGGLNERRAAWLRRIEATGREITFFDAPLYGEERDHFIRQAKAVVNVHFYDSCRFEQIRAAHCLSLGTPVISERAVATRPHEAFEDSVLWLHDEAELNQFFVEDFATPAYFEAVGAAVERFRAADPIEAYAELAAFAVGYAQGHRSCFSSSSVWRPCRIYLGAGADYRHGWLNIDVDPSSAPDVQIDLSRSVALPLDLDSMSAGPCRLEAGSVERIDAGHVLHCVHDLPTLMSNCLQLLCEGGELQMEAACGPAEIVWQDPRNVREITEDIWRSFSDRFYQHGWYEHRLDLIEIAYLDEAGRGCERVGAVRMRVVMRKVRTSLRERMAAMTFQSTLNLPEDASQPWQGVGAVRGSAAAAAAEMAA